MDALTRTRFCKGASQCSFVSSVSVPGEERLTA
jgi:hypothetical protein